MINIFGWISFVVLAMSGIKNFIDMFKDSDVKNRFSSFIALLIMIMADVYIGANLFK